MWVDIVLGTIGGFFAVGIIGMLVWALTRPRDRIQMATSCLFVCTLAYFGVAAHLYGSGSGSSTGIGGVLVGVYAALLYVAMAALAIFHKRWAWHVSMGAFVLHLLAGLALSFSAATHGIAGLIVLAVWLLLGATGLWACVHSGSRQLLSSTA